MLQDVPELLQIVGSIIDLSFVLSSHPCAEAWHVSASTRAGILEPSSQRRGLPRESVCKQARLDLLVLLIVLAHAQGSLLTDRLISARLTESVIFLISKTRYRQRQHEQNVYNS